MKAYSIDPQTQKIEELDLILEANTIYSFFNSILIDESQIITNHVVYTDANSLSSKQKPFFIGEQVLLGKALVLGKDEFEDVEAKIPLKDLETIINYDVTQFYKEVLDILSVTDVNLYRTFNAKKDNENLKLNIEWVIYTFNIADDRTKEYFLTELKKVVNSTEETEAFMQKMAQLALNAAQ